MKTVFIYALCEPGTRTIRYVGKAEFPERRLKAHRSMSRQKKNHLGYWLASLLAPPNLLILKEVLASDWQEWEQRYIRCARAMGFDLVNGTEGGEGACLSGEKHYLFGKKMPPERIEKIRASMVGKHAGEKNPNFGKRASLETRVKMSAAHAGDKAFWFGKKLSPETRVKLSAAHIGKQSPETVLKRIMTHSVTRILEICQLLE